jgi:hypothetical protein
MSKVNHNIHKYLQNRNYKNKIVDFIDHSLTRKDFAVKQDSDGALYVYKTTDEQTKNHQMDHQKSPDGCMYEIKVKK